MAPSLFDEEAVTSYISPQERNTFYHCWDLGDTALNRGYYIVIVTLLVSLLAEPCLHGEERDSHVDVCAQAAAVSGGEAFMDCLAGLAFLCQSPAGQPTVYGGADGGVGHRDISKIFRGPSSVGHTSFNPVLWGMAPLFMLTDWMNRMLRLGYSFQF